MRSAQSTKVPCRVKRPRWSWFAGRGTSQAGGAHQPGSPVEFQAGLPVEAGLSVVAGTLSGTVTRSDSGAASP